MLGISSKLGRTPLLLASLGRHLSSTPCAAAAAATDLSAAAAQRPCSDAAGENARLRRSLALSYRLLDRLALNEGTCNHLTVEAPARDGSGRKVMLLAPGTIVVISKPAVLLFVLKASFIYPCRSPS